MTTTQETTTQETTTHTATTAPSLLHLDASIRPTGSVTRELSAHFAAHWRRARPGAGYVHRDLAAEPVPHLTHAVREALLDGADHGEPPQERALSEALTAEVRAASTIVLGVPMYNYAIPSTVKAWLDRLVTPAHMVAPDGGPGPLSGTSVVVVTARGGSYAPGTPREGWDHQEPYLRDVLRSIGLADDLAFVHAELTHANVFPQMASLRPLAEKSLAAAYESLERLAA
ncbi:FMN-dependent NADH-azoreductase [Streptomyces sp. NPDC053493]|uniref:FMN-dependent NADH-azoreductase n=1 Tax=Streptomyces sp. NPDC053493 TaxID=3365705 RepID=UPI0037D27146